MAKKTVADQQTAFLKYELESNDPRRQKVALQEVCRLYRSGNQFSPQTRISFEMEIAGLTVNSDDDKVVRWCLNSIARLGTQNSTGRSVEAALKRHEEKPEIVAAAVSALAYLYRGQMPTLPALANVNPETQMLAAMQTVPPDMLDLGGLTIDLQRADADTLKLALIVVGLNKDIQNLLHPKHENGVIVRDLGQHDDPIVKQYSVWAVIENNLLTLDHLGIPFADIEKEPANVQSKMLQLGATSIEDLSQRQTLIIQGSNLQSVDAREGLSKGLVSTFYDGLQDVTLSWFETEQSKRVQLLLAEHFARYSGESPSYREKALELLDAGSEFRERVLLGAEGLPLYVEIRTKEANPEDLFSMLGDSEQQQLIQRVKMKAATNVLVLNATPEDQKYIRPDKEGAILTEKQKMLQDPVKPLHIIQRHAVRLDQIQQELLNNRPRILHFSGHGSPGELVFENRDGSSAVLNGDLMASIVEAYGELDCIVFHACFTEDVARACAKHVSTVIGSTGSINDETAPTFTFAFYQAVAHGRSYENAFQMGLNEVSTIDPSEAKLYKIIQ